MFIFVLCYDCFEETSPIEDKAERKEEVSLIRNEVRQEKEDSLPPLKKEVSNPFAIIEEPATLPDVVILWIYLKFKSMFLNYYLSLRRKMLQVNWWKMK